jgi:hypothetical protein
MGNNFYTKWTSSTDFQVANMDPPLGELDRAITYLKNPIVYCDGNIDYDKATGVLTWSATLKIIFNRTNGQSIRNDIVAGNITLSDNEFAYVDLSETHGAAVSVAKAAVTGEAASNFIAYNRIVLGYRDTTSDQFIPVYLRQWTNRRGFIHLFHPSVAIGSAALVADPDSDTNLHGQFADDISYDSNYVKYILTVPNDIDISRDIKMTAKIRLGGADTGKHSYIFLHSCVADSGPFTGSPGDAVTKNWAGDGSGAEGDVETILSSQVMTNWAAALTPGNLWVIYWSRNGSDGTNDTSTVDSFTGPIMIEYGKL